MTNLIARVRENRFHISSRLLITTMIKYNEEENCAESASFYTVKLR